MGGGWLDQLKIRLTSAELARLGLSLAIHKEYTYTTNNVSAEKVVAKKV